MHPACTLCSALAGQRVVPPQPPYGCLQDRRDRTWQLHIISILEFLLLILLGRVFTAFWMFVIHGTSAMKSRALRLLCLLTQTPAAMNYIA